MSDAALETTRYDSADYLDSEAAIVAYLKLAFEEGDAADIRAALNAVAREALYKGLGANGNPKLMTLLAVVRALGVKLSVAAR